MKNSKFSSRCLVSFKIISSEGTRNSRISRHKTNLVTSVNNRHLCAMVRSAYLAVG